MTEPPGPDQRELAAAEERLRDLAARWEAAGDLQAFAGREPFWTCAQHAAVLLPEYDRLRAVADAAWNLHLVMDCDCPEWGAFDEALANLGGGDSGE
jgi:hypothetical protein